MKGARKRPELRVDRKARAAYLYMPGEVGSVERTIQALDGVLIDVDADGAVVGVEVLW